MESLFNPNVPNGTSLPIQDTPPMQAATGTRPGNSTSTFNSIDQRSRAYQAQLDTYIHQEIVFHTYKRRMVCSTVAFAVITVVFGVLTSCIHEQHDSADSTSLHGASSFHEKPLAVISKGLAFTTMSLTGLCFLGALASHFFQARSRELMVKLSNEFAALQARP